MKPQIDDVYYSDRRKEHWVIIAHDKDPDFVHALLVKGKKPKGLTQKVPFEMFSNFQKKDISPFTVDVDFSKLSPAALEITRVRYNAVMGLVNNNLIFDPKKRFKLFRDGFGGLKKSALLKLVPTFWMRGQTESALVPNLNLCGGPGTQKTFKEEGEKRIIAAGKRAYSLTEKDKRDIKAQFFKDYKKKSIEKSYLDYLDKFFPNEKIFPSLKQYYEWGTRQNGINNKKKLTKEEEVDAILNGSAIDSVFGPCSEFLIDSTVDNVYVQSDDIPGLVVGRLTLYFIVDVYTGLICGFYLTNEHPSYLVAGKALINAATDKVEFCKQYKISITNYQWPCMHIPIRLIADRGELVSNAASQIAKNLKIKLTNLPAYSPELKGYVETQFRSWQLKLKDILFEHGLVEPKANSRLIENPAKKARLTISGLYKLIIEHVLHYNKTHRLWDHPHIQKMLAENVDPSPINIWAWANTKGLGNPRKRNTIELWRNLLELKEYRCTSKGIDIKGNMFKPIDASYKWVLAEIENKKEKAKVASVPYSNIHKYIYYNNEFIPLTTRRGVTSTSDLEFFYTCEYIQDRKNALKDEILESDRELNRRSNQIVKEEVKKRPKPTSIKNLRENRSAETEKRRVKELDSLDPAFNNQPEVSKEKEDHNHISPSKFDSLRKLKLH